MKQDVVRTLDCFEQLMLALQDLDLGHIADAVFTCRAVHHHLFSWPKNEHGSRRNGKYHPSKPLIAHV